MAVSPVSIFTLASSLIASTVLALCTLDWVTGQVMTADGGVALFSPIDPTER